MIVLNVEKRIQFNDILIVVCICVLIIFAYTKFSPSDGIVTQTQTQNVTVNTGGDPININNASIEAIESLPNIGPVLAKEIVRGRPWNDVYELERIDGIGNETIKLLKEVIVCK